MRNLSHRTIHLMIILISVAALSTTAFAGSGMEDALWNRDWRTMDEIFSSSTISPREKSIYVNGLWEQGRYAEGIGILESIYQDYPNDLRAYADMLFILGLERTEKKQEAFERGKVAWESAPENLKYYLAYAMARLSRDFDMNDESLMWLRRMHEFAAERRQAVTALSQIMETGAASADEAAELLVASPANAGALAALTATDPERASGMVAYALGHTAYAAGNYREAMRLFNLALNDENIGENAKYYAAFAAYRENLDDTAFRLWSEVALTGFEYPQRSVQRLEALAARSHRSDIIAAFKQAADARVLDYPDVASDALAATIRIGGAADAREAEIRLFSEHASSSQAATIRWERGWRAWRERRYREAFDQWDAGYSPDISNAELASRLLYWQIRALERLNSPVAAERVRMQLISTWPAEYHTFLVSEDGGIRQEPAPEKFVTPSELMDWGFLTYARMEGANITASNVTSEDIPKLYRTAGLMARDNDYVSAVRTFIVMRRVFPSEDQASSELMKLAYPRAFEANVRAASERTGLPVETIWGVMRQESLYQPDVTSSAGAYGLMQLMPATARQEARKMDMPDDAYLTPANNVMLGANYLTGLFARYTSPPLVFAAYNAGGSRVNRWTEELSTTDMPYWIESIPFRETRGFVKAVMRNINVYRQIYSGGNR